MGNWLAFWTAPLTAGRCLARCQLAGVRGERPTLLLHSGYGCGDGRDAGEHQRDAAARSSPAPARAGLSSLGRAAADVVGRPDRTAGARVGTRHSARAGE